jgi:hypothetical protein
VALLPPPAFLLYSPVSRLAAVGRTSNGVIAAGIWRIVVAFPWAMPYAFLSHIANPSLPPYRSTKQISSGICARSYEAQPHI